MVGSRSETRLSLPPVLTEKDIFHNMVKNYPKVSRIKRMDDEKERLLKLQMSQLDLKTKEMLPRYTNLIKSN